MNCINERAARKFADLRPTRGDPRRPKDNPIIHQPMPLLILLIVFKPAVAPCWCSGEEMALKKEEISPLTDGGEGMVNFYLN